MPTALLIELGAGRAYQTTTRDFEGNKSDGVVYLARLAFGDYEFNYLNVLGIAGNTVLIGRDILNELDVRLDGPNRTLTIS